jgi:hypothetical protein
VNSAHVPAKDAVSDLRPVPLNSDSSPAGLATRTVCTLAKFLFGMVTRAVALQRTALRIMVTDISLDVCYAGGVMETSLVAGYVLEETNTIVIWGSGRECVVLSPGKDQSVIRGTWNDFWALPGIVPSGALALTRNWHPILYQ